MDHLQTFQLISHWRSFKQCPVMRHWSASRCGISTTFTCVAFGLLFNIWTFLRFHNLTTNRSMELLMRGTEIFFSRGEVLECTCKQQCIIKGPFLECTTHPDHAQSTMADQTWMQIWVASPWPGQWTVHYRSSRLADRLSCHIILSHQAHDLRPLVARAALRAGVRSPLKSPRGPIRPDANGWNVHFVRLNLHQISIA